VRSPHCAACAPLHRPQLVPGPQAHHQHRGDLPPAQEVSHPPSRTQLVPVATQRTARHSQPRPLAAQTTPYYAHLLMTPLSYASATHPGSLWPTTHALLRNRSLQFLPTDGWSSGQQNSQVCPRTRHSSYTVPCRALMREYCSVHWHKLGVVRPCTRRCSTRCLSGRVPSVMTHLTSFSFSCCGHFSVTAEPCRWRSAQETRVLISTGFSTLCAQILAQMLPRVRILSHCHHAHRSYYFLSDACTIPSSLPILA
jgi:hypothetical protein